MMDTLYNIIVSIIGEPPVGLEWIIYVCAVILLLYFVQAFMIMIRMICGVFK